MRNPLGSVLILASFSAFGCDSGTPVAFTGVGAPCESSDECTPGSICSGDICAELCARSGECSEASHQCLNGVCAEGTVGECQGDIDCAMPGICHGVLGALCDDGTCVYLPLTDASACPSATGPAGNMDGSCLSGTCVECIDETDCTNPSMTFPECFSPTCVGNVCGADVLELVECQAEACVGGTNFERRLCGAAGDCPPSAPDTSCGAYACNGAGTACLDLCVDDSHCASTHYCNATGGTCEPKVANGQPCPAPEGARRCLSNHCTADVCCAMGDCCDDPSDCPGSYTQAASCTDPMNTTCEGTRGDPTCTNFQCGTATVADDNACDALSRPCPNNFADIPCTSTSVRPVTCPTVCDGTNCASGYECMAPDCVLLPGLGSMCAGSCGGMGLKCENSVCCATTSGTCCDDNSDCVGYVCDATTTFACLTSCAGGQSECQSGFECFNQVCYDMLPDGAPCTGGGVPCASGFCRTDWDGSGTFCADDSTSCVDAGAGTTPTDRNAGYSFCQAGQEISCSGGAWTTNGCGVFACTGSTCETACGPPEDDGRCAAGLHCYTGDWSCYGSATGDKCDVNGECSSSNCECANSTCGDRACNANCVCYYGTNGACSTPLPNGSQDPFDCDSGGFACWGGNCATGNIGIGGTTCYANGQCQSNVCDLSGVGETGRCCTSDTGYINECCDTDGDCAGGFCVTSIDGAAKNRCNTGQAGTPCDNDSDCAAGLHCRESTDTCIDGSPGEVCDNNGDCDAGQCECSDNSCSIRRCSSTDCNPCRYMIFPSTSCQVSSGNILSGFDDADNSCGAVACNGSGGCLPTLTCGCRYDDAGPPPQPCAVPDWSDCGGMTPVCAAGSGSPGAICGCTCQ